MRPQSQRTTQSLDRITVAPERLPLANASARVSRDAFQDAVVLAQKRLPPQLATFRPFIGPLTGHITPRHLRLSGDS